MSLSQSELKDCLYAATTAALRAGIRIRSYYGRELEVGRKGFDYEKSDLVTIADKEAQDVIEGILHDFHPEIGFLAEENGHDSNSTRFEKPYFWSIDPLDGTKAFVNHMNGFAVSIGLVKQDGTPLLGVVYFPSTDGLYYSYEGKGAFFHDRKLHMPEESGKVKLLISEAETLSPINNKFYNQLSADLLENEQIKKVNPEMIIAPVQKGTMIANGECPTIWYGLPRKKLGVSLWDFAAIAAIVKHSGGHVSDMYGNPLDLNRKDSTILHHKGFLMTTSGELANDTLSTFKKFHSEFQF